MKNLKSLNLNVALGGFLLVLSLQQSSSAQEVTGSWTGIESYNIELSTLGQPPQIFSGTQSAFFGITTIHDGGVVFVEMQVSGAFVVPGLGPITVFGPESSQDPFGPTSASGSLSLIAPPIVDSGNFSLAYQSIGSNGVIDVGDGSALAHLNFFSTTLERTVTETATFQTVPEPSSIVLMASGALLVLAVASRRSRRADE